MIDSRAVNRTDVDLFADDALDHPYEHFARMRDSGPVIWLDRSDMWAFPRYAQVRAALGNWKMFSSADGVCVAPKFNDFYRGTVLASDPPQHSKLRAVLSDRLSARSIHALQADIQERADQLVAKVVAKKSFDAVTELAQVFPVSIVADLVGLPEEGREKLLERADGSFNIFGPENQRAIDSLPIFDETFHYISHYGTRERLKPGSYGAAIYEAAERGDIVAEQVIPLMLAYLFAGMDTTVNAISHAVWLLGQHPEQWSELCENPALIGSTFEEVLRIETPVQFFVRTLTTDFEVEGMNMKAGDRVLMMYGSANRDDRKYPEPDRFDIHRNPVDHLAFGFGVHNCSGQALARLEAHSILKSLLRRVERVDVGKPVRHLNNAVRGLGRLPVSVTASRTA